MGIIDVKVMGETINLVQLGEEKVIVRMQMYVKFYAAFFCIK